MTYLQHAFLFIFALLNWAFAFTQSNSNKSTSITPVHLGSSSNAYTAIRTSQDQVWANDQLNTVIFVHRQDITVWGGIQDAKLRFDRSIDGGATFTNDLGPMDGSVGGRSLYPMITGMVESDTFSDPSSAKYLFAAFNQDSSIFRGMNAGVATTSGAPLYTTGHTFFSFDDIWIPSGLCMSDTGIFWSCAFKVDNSTGESIDSIAILRGEHFYGFAGEDIFWEIDTVMGMNSYTGYDGNIHAIRPNISFSPDGQVGYAAWCGDIVGGMDTTYTACYMRTTNGGASWDGPHQVDLRTFPDLNDSLRIYWKDTTGILPAGNGKPSLSFEFDITVDQEGKLHFFSTVGNSALSFNDPGTIENDLRSGYTIQSTLERFAIDIVVDSLHSASIKYIAPVHGFLWDNGFYPADDEYISMYNHTQVSRNEAGTHIFFSWTDTDCFSSFSGRNYFPDLRIAGLRIADEYQTEIVKLSDGDLIYGGLILFPTMAPTVLTGASDYKLPIVFMSIRIDPLNPCDFLYLGNDAIIDESAFKDPATIHNSYQSNVSSCLIGLDEDWVPETSNLYPNPGSDRIHFDIGVHESTAFMVYIFDLNGKLIDQISLQLSANTTTLSIPIRDLTEGMYLLKLEDGSRSVMRKFIKE